MSDLSVRRHYARLGAVAAMSGVVTLLAGTWLHPIEADPNDAAAAFAEYAADTTWIFSHLLQFLGIVGLGAALVALGAIVDAGRAAVWARLGTFGAASTVALGAALQAVDGVALKAMVDRWAAVTGDAQALAFEGARAVRHIEIGLASLFSLVFALTVLTFSVSLVLSRDFPSWMGWLGLVGGLGTLAAGIAQAYTGFSEMAMLVSMPASAVLFVWAIALGIAMWRLEPG